jgi:glc operon protein GlcG
MPIDFERWRPGVLPSPADQLLPAEWATDVISAAVAKAEELNVAMTIAIVDIGALPVLLYRMAGAMSFSVDLAIAKAKTSATTKQPSHNWAALVREGGPLHGAMLPSGLVTIAGGFPLIRDGFLLGALGVSGAEWEDVAIASVCIRAAHCAEDDVADALSRSERRNAAP